MSRLRAVLFGCCVGSLLLLFSACSDEISTRRVRSLVQAVVERGRPPGVELGVVTYPKDSDATPTQYDWRTKRLTPSRYRLGYGLPAFAAKSVALDYADFAARMRHTRLADGRFRWSAPRHCAGGLHCVYEELSHQSHAAVLPVSERFQRRVQAAGMSRYSAAVLIISFVQHLTYRIPERSPFGILPPALVLKEGWGDCDSKSLLAYLLLKEVGIRSVLLSSRAHKHTMLGVALVTPGAHFQWQGRRYAFVEMTAKDAPIGYRNRRMRRPNDWRVEDLTGGRIGTLEVRRSPTTGRRRTVARRRAVTRRRTTSRRRLRGKRRRRTRRRKTTQKRRERLARPRSVGRPPKAPSDR